MRGVETVDFLDSVLILQFFSFKMIIKPSRTLVIPLKKKLNVSFKTIYNLVFINLLRDRRIKD